MRYLRSLGGELLERQQAAERAIRTMGITFTVYSDAGDIDRAWPFDVIPRVISTQEWAGITAGLVQRLTAINLFIDDVYGAAKIVKDGVVPADLIRSSANFRKPSAGVDTLGLWAHFLVAASSTTRTAHASPRGRSAAVHQACRHAGKRAGHASGCLPTCS